MVEQVQVCWSRQDPVAVTWENLQELRQRFPQAEAWGQASFQGGKNVTTATSSDQPQGKDDQGKEPISHNEQRRKSARERQPNRLYNSSVWTQ